MSAGSIKGKDFTFNDSDSEKEQTKCFEHNMTIGKMSNNSWTMNSGKLTPRFSNHILRNRGVWVDNEAKQDNALFNCAQERIRGQCSSSEIDRIKESGRAPSFGMLLQVKKSQSQAQTYNQIDSNEKKLPQSQSSSESKGLQQTTNNSYANILQYYPYQSSTTLPSDGLKWQTNKYNQQIIGAQALKNPAKLYSEPMKYTGEQDSFKYKVKIYEEKCSHAGINDDQGKAKTFSTMLTGDSLSYFYLLPLCNSFAAICSAMTNHFEGLESKLNAVNKWNSLNLLTRISSDPQKTTAEDFEAFVSELRKLQYKPPSDLWTEQILHMKLMTTCREVPAYVLACYKPAPDLPTFINDLRNSIGTKETSATISESFYTDRRIRSSNEYRSRNDPRRHIRGK
ncbi:hypothetical protein GcC1_196023 [Golovinomyces cichoracearum]|uniref:Integrase and RNaseH domain-containing protein n=1 Tax=Golovinomyces cichoracearum TaxID=62708 RepID=A0A420HGK4_9PEZI|nr:hypothetical protein GcC1_196023 [Golovinomyces cichoracearum]